MQFNIQGAEHPKPVVTVTLKNDPADPSRVTMMHCMNCGQKLVQFTGTIVQVIPGGLPIEMLKQQARLIVSCGFKGVGCKTKYLINQII